MPIRDVRVHVSVLYGTEAYRVFTQKHDCMTQPDSKHKYSSAQPADAFMLKLPVSWKQRVC